MHLRLRRVRRHIQDHAFGQVQVIYTFDQTNGANSDSPLVLGTGNFYGTTSLGGFVALLDRAGKGPAARRRTRGLLPALPRASSLGVFADAATDEFPAFVPRDVIRAFRVPLFLTVDDHDVWTNTPVCGENSKAIAWPLWSLNQLRQMNHTVSHSTLHQK
jgi:hypothetical protein